jgi:hypothetical protein
MLVMPLVEKFAPVAAGMGADRDDACSRDQGVNEAVAQ